MAESNPSTSSSDKLEYVPKDSKTKSLDTHGADPELLDLMLEMGVNRNLAIKSLIFSGNKSIEAAFTWSAEMSPEELEEISLKPFEEDEWVDIEEETESPSYPKMVLIVNSELKMKTGKIAAQVGHAVLDLYRKIKYGGTPKQKMALTMWSNYGETMVVVKGNNIQHLKDLKAEAESKRLLCYQVKDAGRTQVAEGSQTVLAMFGYSKELEEITGKLKLL